MTEGAPRDRAGYLATLVVTRWALVRRPSVSLPDSTALELHFRNRLDCPPPNSTLVLSPNSTRTQVVSSDATPPTPLTPDSNTQLWRSPHRLAKETKERGETPSPARPLPTLSLSRRSNAALYRSGAFAPPFSARGGKFQESSRVFLLLVTVTSVYPFQNIGAGVVEVFSLRSIWFLLTVAFVL